MKNSTIFLLAFVILLGFCTPNKNIIAQENSITIQVKLPSEKVITIEELVPGEAADLVGLPFPFQYLNGGKLLFDEESLNESITITIEVPDFAELKQNAVEFGEKIASAARFTVESDDGVVSPYYFEKPVELTLPIPENLPTDLGEKISTFVLAFKDTEGNFDTTGIRTRTRDEVNRVLTAEVEHFSDIVMTSSEYLGLPTYVDGDDERIIPVEYTLHQNYPNPFNPKTTIRYEIPERTNVQINIYTILGQKIDTLVNEIHEPGIYSTVFVSGELPSGIYIVSLGTGEQKQLIRITLLK